MSVTNETTRVSYTGDGAETDFTVTFQFGSASEILVVLRDNDAETEEELDYISDYLVTGGDGDTGEIQLDVAPTADETVVIIHNPEFKQQVEFPEYGAIPSTTLERSLDKLTWMVQRCKDIVTRSMRLTDGAPADFDTSIPPLEAGKALAVKADLSGFEFAFDAADIAAASENAEATAEAAAAAIAAAAAAEAATYSNVFRDVVELDDDYTVDPETDNGTLFLVDSTAEAISLVMPQISTLAGFPFNVAFKKVAGGNAVAVERSGSDTFDNGSTLKALPSNGQGMMLTAGESTAAKWGSMDFASIGDIFTDPAFFGTVTVFGDIDADGDLDVGDDGTFGGDVTITGALGVTGNSILSGTVVHQQYMIHPNEYDAGNSGTSKTISWTNGSAQKLTLTGNCTLTITDPSSTGSIYILRLIQGSGPYTMTWPSTVKWPENASAPTLTSTSGRKDVFSFYWNGTNYEASYLKGYNS